MPRLARSRSLLIPDLPGFGASAELPGRHSSRALAAEVRAVLDQLGVGEFELGGLCLGCSVALELLDQAPRRVRRLLLHTPFLEPRGVPPGVRLQVRVSTLPGALEAIAYLGRRRWLADLYRRLLVEGDAAVDRRSADVNFLNQLRARPRAAREWLRDGTRRDFTPLLDGWPGPLEVVAAADDRLLDQARLSAYCERRPGTRLALIASAGHGWDRELIRRQLDELERFLDGGPTGPGA